jgi:hypothetical protein
MMVLEGLVSGLSTTCISWRAVDFEMDEFRFFWNLIIMGLEGLLGGVVWTLHVWQLKSRLDFF